MKRGFTLVEVVVAMGVASVILFLTLTTFNNLSYRSFISFGQQSEIQSNSTLNLDRIAKYLRQANDILIAGDQSVTFYSYATDEALVKSKMRFFLTEQVLKQGIIAPLGTPPNYTYNGPETFYTLSNSVVGTGPIFTYYDEDGNLLNQPVTAALVTMIKVNLTYRLSGVFSPAIAVYSTSIQFRNKKTNL